MKIVLTISTVLIFAFLFLLAGPRVLKLVGKGQVPEMTPEKAQNFFETVGGINEVNREAKMLFDQLGTNEWAFLYPQDLTNAPAISSLYSICKNYSGRDYSGTSLAISPENGRHIEIKFGNHWSLKRFDIFNPNATITFNPPPNWFQVSSNIFASR